MRDIVLTDVICLFDRDIVDKGGSDDGIITSFWFCIKFETVKENIKLQEKLKSSSSLLATVTTEL